MSTAYTFRKSFYLLWVGLLLLVEGWPLAALSQGLNPHFSHLQMKDGLNQSSVYSISEDEKGFIWFGTSSGLNRYDGKQIKSYKVAKGLPPSSNFVGFKSAVINGNNRLYGSRAGLVMYDNHLDSLVQFIPWKDKVLFSAYLDIVGIEDNTWLWFTDCLNRVFRYNLITKVHHVIYMEDPPKTNRYPVLIDHTLWYTTLKGVVCYNVNSGKKQLFMAPVFKVNQKLILRSIHKLSNNNYILTLFEGVYTLNTSTGEYKELKKFDDKVQCILSVLDENGRLIIGTLQSGLYILTPEGKTYNYPFTGVLETGVGSNIITALFIDRNQNVWIGCDGFGVSRFNLKQQKFYLFRNKTNKTDYFNANFIKCFYQQNDSILWYGTHESGLYRLNKNTFQATQIKSNLLGGNVIDDIALYDQDRLLVNSGAGAGLLDLKTLKVSMFKPPKFNTVFLNGHSFMRKAFKTKKGNWYITCREGLAYQKDSATLELVKLPWGTPYLNAIYQTEDSIIWVGGLEFGPTYCLKELSNGQLKIVNQLFKGNNMRCFLQTQTDRVWMASENGLIDYDIKTGKFNTYGIEEGFANDYIYGILKGNSKTLWLSSNKGLIAFDYGQKTVYNYTISDGLQSNEYNTNSYYLSANNIAYFGGINGFNYFYTHKIPFNTHAPDVVLTGFSVNENAHFLKTNVTQIKNVELPFDNNNIAFTFIGIDYQNADRNNYKIRLEGQDAQWINNGTLNFIRYSALKPGKYTFKAMSANADGFWSKPETLMHLTILPPWWQTWWFYTIAYATILIAMFFMIRFFATIKLKNQLRKLEKLEAINQERTRISQDMHDDLGSGLTKIAITAQLLKSNMTDTLAIAKHIDKMNQTATDLLDNMGHIIWAMNANNDTLDNFLAYTRTYIANFAEDIGLPVKIQFEKVNDTIPLNQILRRNLFLVVKETFNNIAKYANATHVTVSFSETNTTYTLTIHDNGVGFDPNNSRAFGNGLYNMRKRMADINGTFQLTSEIGKGTTTILIWDK